MVKSGNMHLTKHYTETRQAGFSALKSRHGYCWRDGGVSETRTADVGLACQRQHDTGDSGHARCDARRRASLRLPALSQHRHQVSGGANRVREGMGAGRSKHGDSGETVQGESTDAGFLRTALIGVADQVGSVSAATFHFLHHDLIVRQHDNAKAVHLPIGHPGGEAGKGRVQGGDAFGELYSMLKEAFYDPGGFELVGFHGWKYTPILTGLEIFSGNLALWKWPHSWAGGPGVVPWAGGGAGNAPLL